MVDFNEYAKKNVDPREAKRICDSNKNVYYIVKSASEKNVRIALERNTWATTPKNERVFDEDYSRGSNVILVFSVNGTSHYWGYALMKSRPGRGSVRESVFFFPDGRPFTGNQFDITWVRALYLPFSECANINNKLNDNLPIKVARDGQKIDSESGKELCNRFERKFQQLLYSSQQQLFNQFYGALNAAYPLPHLHGTKGNVKPVAAVPMPYFAFPTFTSPLNDPKSQASSATTQEQSLNHPLSLDDALMSAYYNPSLSIFPVDVSNMSYEHYTSLYNISYNFWLGPPDTEVKQEEN